MQSGELLVFTLCNFTLQKSIVLQSCKMQSGWCNRALVSDFQNSVESNSEKVIEEYKILNAWGCGQGFWNIFWNIFLKFRTKKSFGMPSSYLKMVWMKYCLKTPHSSASAERVFLWLALIKKIKLGTRTFNVNTCNSLTSVLSLIKPRQDHENCVCQSPN